MTSTAPTLSVENLQVTAAHRSGTTKPDQLLRGLTFSIAPGERVGLIGESGSGKSLTALAIMGLLPDTLTPTGSIRLGGVDNADDTDLLDAAEKTLSELRGNAMAMIFQEPMTALNPLMRVGDQVAEAMTQHRTADRPDAAARALDLLAQVQLPAPAQTARAFPHQLSGGQRQRVMIAMALANNPRLLLCDEPTTALDVTVQAEVLRLIGDLVHERETSLLFISHDIGVVAGICDRILVLQDGAIVEDGPVDQILTAAQHPYTRSLIAASDLTKVDERGRLFTGGATAPATATATRSAPDTHVPHHQVRTDLDESIVFNEVAPASGDALIRVRNLGRQYRGRGGSILRRGPAISALEGVSFDVAAGQRFGIVGESGSGKSTLMRLLCALDTPTTGSIQVAGQQLANAKERQLRHFRSQVQIVFQDPMGSLDPRMRVEQIVAEPLRGIGRDETRDRVLAQLQAVGLDADVLQRFPHQFSGGQRQRISIARALVTRPSVLVADEAVSALDVSVRAQVLNLLADLADEYSFTLVFVSHDLGVIRHACDTVAVLSGGRIVEAGPTAEVYDRPTHPYTQQLVAATPTLSEIAGGTP